MQHIGLDSTSGKKRGVQNLSEPLDFIMEAASRFELENSGFAGRSIGFSLVFTMILFNIINPIK